ncbi:MAG: hypothetical protein ISS26_06910 [Candidatus Omnitrophica bacterium]|nr:hypothetical protein [Candidatus Omnitrophota bacterium]
MDGIIIDKNRMMNTGVADEAKWIRGEKSGAVCLVKGYAFFKGDCFSAKKLADLILSKAGADFTAFIDLAGSLNGSFALILADNGKVFASVDRIRSFPVFFGKTKEAFFIGGEAHDIKRKMNAAISHHAVEEFLMSGYVSGDNTLCEGLKQLRAGEAVSFSSEGPDSPRVERYYDFYNKDKNQASADSLIEEYDCILHKAFRRLVSSVDGRKIVVPLSGGVDSRLVASMLKKIGYENVLCLSYGVTDNWETRLSRKVAEKIGYDWKYIPYSRKIWHETYRSDMWNDFFYSQDNLSALPNGDEWIAVKQLRERQAIPEDSVFVPGHTGDFITGGHLQYIFAGKEGNITKRDLIDSILKKHYGLWPLKLNKKTARDHLADGLAKYFYERPLGSGQQIADAYEYWEWQERQAKFIVNSVRTYDFWGYEWRLPFWDAEVMDFWSRIPLEFKLGKRLYLDLLRMKDLYGLFSDDLHRKKLDRRRLIGGVPRKLVEYFRGTKGLHGIKNYFVATFLNFNARNVNSIMVKDYIKNVLGRESR